jgi:hypothetical protein
VSDIVLPSQTDLPGIGEARLPNALPWDTVLPTAFAKCDLVRPVLAALRDKSSARVASDPWFQLMRQELVAQAAESERPLSLNEITRRQEIAEAVFYQHEWKKYPLADSARTRRIYDVTLSNAADTSKSATSSPADDLKLRETENILADYIQSVQTVSTDASSTQASRCSTAIAVEKCGAEDGKSNGGPEIPLHSQF